MNKPQSTNDSNKKIFEKLKAISSIEVKFFTRDLRITAQKNQVFNFQE